MTVVYTAAVGRGERRQDIKCFGGDGLFRHDVLEAKRYKILPHLFFHDDVSIWLDSNIWLKAEPAEVADELLNGADIAVFRHPYRKTVWQEFDVLRDDPRFAIPYLQQQLAAQRAAYRFDGLRPNAPLYECSILIRRNNERVNRMMEAWWAQICRWQWRDQVSFPYVLEKFRREVRINDVIGNARDHPLFRHVEQWPTVAPA